MSNRRTRILIPASISFMLAVVVGAAALSNVVTRTDPQLALAIFPPNTVAQARIAEADFISARLAEQDGADNLEQAWDKAGRAANSALSSSPVNPQGLRILAFTTEDDIQRDQLLLAANRQSRRDALTQFLLAQVTATEGNLEQAMIHYDALLRRDTGYRDPAGRGLAQGMASADLPPIVADMLEQSPPWESLLYYYLLREEPSFDGFVELHRLLEGKDVIPLSTSAEFANTLVLKGRVEDAITVARLSGQSALVATSAMTDTEFRLEPKFPGAWLVDPSAATTLRPLRGGGAILSASRGASGVLASRLIALKPGTYRAEIDAKLSEFSSSANGSAQLLTRLACGSGPSAGRTSQTVTINEDCDYAWLSIFVNQPLSRDADFDISSIKVLLDD